MYASLSNGPESNWNEKFLFNKRKYLFGYLLKQVACSGFIS